LPENVAEQVVPGICRLAVEAAFTEAIWRRQLRDGKRHADVEAGIDATDRLAQRAALAMFGDAAKGSDVMRRLNSWHPSAADTYKELNRATHLGHHGSLRALVSRARQLIETIGSKLS